MVDDDDFKTAATTCPAIPGHAAAQAWYASLTTRLESEQERTGIQNQVPVGIAAFFGALNIESHADFVEALGALVIAMLTIGDPYPGRWDPASDIEVFAAAGAVPDRDILAGAEVNHA